MNPDEKQATLDEEHLRLLSLFYYISAGITAAFACFPIIHLIMGIFFVVMGDNGSSFSGSDGPPAFIGWFFIAFASIFILFGWLFAVLDFLVAKNIKLRQRRSFCMIVAGLFCIFIPYGTILGIATFSVLGRESVRVLFDRGSEKINNK
jgi:hypothetical protein